MEWLNPWNPFRLALFLVFAGCFLAQVWQTCVKFFNRETTMIFNSRSERFHC